MTEAELREHVFPTEFRFCLVDERARILNEMGQVIASEFKSSFYAFVEASNFDVT